MGSRTGISAGNIDAAVDQSNLSTCERRNARRHGGLQENAVVVHLLVRAQRVSDAGPERLAQSRLNLEFTQLNGLSRLAGETAGASGKNGRKKASAMLRLMFAHGCIVFLSWTGDPVGITKV